MTAQAGGLASARGRHETLAVVRALLWRRRRRLWLRARNPLVVAAAVAATIAVGFILAQLPRLENSGGELGVGVAAFAELLLAPLFISRNFHISTTKADAQWVLTTPGGPDAVLIERAGALVLGVSVWVASGLGLAALAGRGRPLTSAVVIVLVAAIFSLLHTSLSSLAFKAAAGLAHPVAARLLSGLATIPFLVAMAFVDWLGPVARSAGRLVEGRAHAVDLATFGSLVAVAFIGTAYTLRSASWYVEPMVDAGWRRDQAIIGGIAAASRVSRSWEGPPRLAGPAGAFLFVQLVRLRRSRRYLVTLTAVVGGLATLIAVVLKAFPPAAFAPALALWLLACALPRGKQPWAMEWFARAPSSLRSLLFAWLSRQTFEAALQTIACWFPIAFAWSFGAVSFVVGAIASFLILALLICALNYSSIVLLVQPATSLFVRIFVPVALLGVGAAAWMVSGESVTALGACLAITACIGYVVFFELSVEALDRGN